MSTRISFLIFDVVALTASFAILRFGSYSIFKIFVIIYILSRLLTERIRFSFKKINKFYFWGYLCLTLTTLSAIVLSVGDIWALQASIQFLWMTFYFVLYIFSTTIDGKQIRKFFNIFYFGLLIQIAWSSLQFMVYRIASEDINMVFFQSIYERVGGTSYIKESSFGASGLAWHPSNMAPILVLVYWLSDNIYIKVITIAVSILTNNSTVIIGVSICVIIDVFIRNKKWLLKIKSRTSIIGVIFLVGIVYVIITTDLVNLATSRYLFLYNRIFRGYYDGGSTNAHISYYLSIPEVVKNMPLLKVLFGFGEGCSGYIMTNLVGQYSDYGAWALECDVVNILWSRGIVGFILFYSWLVSIALRGRKINKKYLYVVVAIVFAGVFYNIQFDWLIVLEMMMELAIRNNIDIFHVRKVRLLKRRMNIPEMIKPTVWNKEST